MNKILIARELHGLLDQDKSFLHRTGLEVFIAATNDEALKIHRAERVDLIITQLALPGIDSERFCSLIREDEDLRAVSLIMVCANSPEAIERSGRCRANAVLLEPVHPFVLMVKAQQLLDIAARETVRVLLEVRLDGHAKDEAFYGSSRNISATGMLLETETPLAEGDRLSCAFFLPNAKKVRVSGKIVRAIEPAPGDESYQYGMMFTDLAPGTQEQLRAYVEHTSRRKQPGDA